MEILLIAAVVIAFIAYSNSNAKQQDAEMRLKDKEKREKSLQYALNQITERYERNVQERINYGMYEGALFSLNDRYVNDPNWSHEDKMKQFDRVVYKAYIEDIENKDMYTALSNTLMMYAIEFFRDYGGTHGLSPTMFEYHSGYIDDDGSRYDKIAYNSYINICRKRVERLADVIFGNLFQYDYSFIDKKTVYNMVSMFHMNQNPIFDYAKSGPYSDKLLIFFKKHASEHFDLPNNINSIGDLYVELYKQMKQA